MIGKLSLIKKSLNYFAPSSLNGLQLWLDAADVSTITQSGGLVSQWSDKSGKGHHATQGVGGSQPGFTSSFINGLPAIVFDNADFMTVAHDAGLQFDSGSGYSIFMAIHPDGYRSHGSGINCFLSKGDAYILTPHYNLQVASDNDITFQSGNNEISLVDGVPVDGSPRIFSAIMDNINTDATIYINSGNSVLNGTATIGSDNTFNLTVGGATGVTTRYGQGKYLEILIYNRPVDAAERNKIEIYLADKWGIYHVNANWIKNYAIPVQAAIHASKLDKSQVNTTASPLICWLDASDSSTVTKDGSNFVSQWSDKSPQSNHATQPNQTNKPINANNAIIFDGVNDWLLLPNNIRDQLAMGQNHTVFIKFKAAATGGVYTILSSALSASDAMVAQIKTNIMIAGYWNGTSYAGNVKSATFTETAHKNSLSITHTASTTPNFYLNGTSSAGTSSPDVGGSAQAVLGTRNDGVQWFSGEIYEVIIYNKVLDATQRQRIEAYLREPEEIAVYSIHGQSNAKGRGYISELPGNLTGGQDNRYIWNGSAFNKLEAGVNNDGYDETRFGPEMSFAEYLYNATGKKIYIIKHAVDGTSLEVDWDPSTGSVYSAMIAKDNAATAYLQSLGKIVNRKGMLWYQGEADSAVQAQADAYLTNLPLFVSAYRTHTGNSNLRITIIKVRGNPDLTYMKTVQLAQEIYVKSDNNARLTYTDGIAFLDSLHVNSASQIEIGKSAAYDLL